MKGYRVKDVLVQLDCLPLEADDTFFIHNSLFAFGKPLDITFNELPGFFYTALRKKIGNSGTIAVPTFNFDFCAGKPFDRQETPSKGMGVFSEYVRNLDGALRSHHPMQSISMIGEKKGYVIENDTESAFSKEGPFDRLLKLNSKILLLGADFNSVSMIHWVEEKNEVPYRYWKSFSGDYLDNGKRTKRTYKLFVRSLELNPQLKMYYVERVLAKQKKLFSTKIGSGFIKVFSMKDFVAIADECIIKNPYFFVSNHPKFECL